MRTSTQARGKWMNNLRTELNKILESIHPRVYFMEAPDKVEFPYLVYDLPQSYFNDDLEVFNLDVDVWDDKDDTTEIETLSQAIWNMFNKYYHIDENMQFSIYRANRMTIEDDDPRIRRRTLMFNIRYHDRSVN